MSVDASRFPLSWPAGWPRTPAGDRRRAAFRKTIRGTDPTTGAIVHGAAERALTVTDALRRLTRELAFLEATEEILSTNIAVRLDGLPRADQKEPADPGAAVYFTRKGKPISLACDAWTRTADNIAALAQHIDALRRIERYGVGTLDQAFAGYAALPPAAMEWWLVLEVPPNATREQAEAAFLRLARQHHPDQRGGSHDGMARLTAAREQAKAALT